MGSGSVSEHVRFVGQLTFDDREGQSGPKPQFANNGAQKLTYELEHSVHESRCQQRNVLSKVVTMFCFLRRITTETGFSVALLGILLFALTSEAAARDHRRALLVGCTEYPACKTIRPLNGPRNDIPLFTRMLKETFGFRDSEITTLLSWPDDERLRPTRKNIVREFENLIEEAQPGSQIVILMSGHGTQVPVSDDDSGNGDRFEDDGLDEAFLPADVLPWDGQKVPNAVLDNEFRAWLDALADKGAHVWITFDTCHSGTMTRAVSFSEPVEQSRMVRAQDLAIPTERLTGRGHAPTLEEEPFTAGLARERPSGGTVVAFSAAQAFEEAPELPRPKDAPRNPANYYGLFTYSLVKAIQRQRNSLSYRDLSQSILNLYCAERGSRGPTPVFEGELTRQVLGIEDWSSHADYSVRFEEGEYRIAGGELNGLTIGSILAVVEPPTMQDAEPTVVGYLRIVSSTPVDSVGEPCHEDGSSSSSSLTLTDTSRCRMHIQDLGDMRVNLALVSEAELPSEFATTLKTTLNELPEATRKLFHWQEDPKVADWIMHLASPETANSRYGVTTERAVLVLAPRGASAISIEDEGSGELQRLQVVHGLPKGTDQRGWEELGQQLGNELRKIFAWQNVWRVSDSAAAGDDEGDLVLTLKVRRDGQEVINPPVLYSGEKVEVQLSNEGTRDWWVTLMFLGSDASIAHWTSGSIKAASDFRTLRATVTGTTRGLEGFVVFASPISVSRLEPDFRFLEQSGLLDLDEETTRSVSKSPNSPFGTLLAGARSGTSTRSMMMETPEQPSVVLRSWVTRRRSGD